MTESQPPAMSCEEILRALNDYVDGETLSAICREFATHLAGCNRARIVVDNIRTRFACTRTVSRTRAVGTVGPPAGCPSPQVAERFPTAGT